MNLRQFHAHQNREMNMVHKEGRKDRSQRHNAGSQRGRRYRRLLMQNRRLATKGGREGKAARKWLLAHDIALPKLPVGGNWGRHDAAERAEVGALIRAAVARATTPRGGRSTSLPSSQDERPSPAVIARRDADLRRTTLMAQERERYSRPTPQRFLYLP